MTALTPDQVMAQGQANQRTLETILQARLNLLGKQQEAQRIKLSERQVSIAEEQAKRAAEEFDLSKEEAKETKAAIKRIGSLKDITAAPIEDLLLVNKGTLPQILAIAAGQKEKTTKDPQEIALIKRIAQEQQELNVDIEETPTAKILAVVNGTKRKEDKPLRLQAIKDLQDDPMFNFKSLDEQMMAVEQRVRLMEGKSAAPVQADPSARIKELGPLLWEAYKQQNQTKE